MENLWCVCVFLKTVSFSDPTRHLRRIKIEKFSLPCKNKVSKNQRLIVSNVKINLKEPKTSSWDQFDTQLDEDQEQIAEGNYYFQLWILKS